MTSMTIQRTAAAVAILAVVLIVGCTEKAVSPTKASNAAESDPRAKVLGVEHVGTAKETPETTSTAKSDITKAQEANAMPLPGQANDHSTLSPKPSQKSATQGR